MILMQQTVLLVMTIAGNDIEMIVTKWIAKPFNVTWGDE